MHKTEDHLPCLQTLSHSVNKHQIESLASKGLVPVQRRIVAGTQGWQCYCGIHQSIFGTPHLRQFRHLCQCFRY